MKTTRFGLVVRLLEGTFAILFLVQIYLNLAMRRQIGELKSEVRRAHLAALSDTFHVGDKLAPLPVRSLDCKELLLDPASWRINILLLVIDPSCETCRIAVDDIREQRFRKRGFVILSTASKGAMEFAQPKGIAPFTYVLQTSNLDNHTRAKFAHPPITLLLSPTATITQICDRPLTCR